MFKKMYLMAAAALLLSGCVNFVAMKAPDKSDSRIGAIKQVQGTTKFAGNQPGLAELAQQTKIISDQVHLVYKLQYESFTKGDHVFPFAPFSESRDLALKLAPELGKLARDSHTLYAMSQRAPGKLSAEGAAFARQAYGYASSSAKAMAPMIAYPTAGIEWNIAFLMSKKREAEMNAALKQAMEDVKELDASSQSFAADIVATSSTGVAVPAVKQQNDGAAYTMKVLVVGTADKSDRNRLAKALDKAENAFPKPGNLLIKVNLTHLGGTFLPSRTTAFLTNMVTAFIEGSTTFSASVQLNGGKAIPLSMDMDAMEAKETSNLVTIATYATLTQAVVAAYGDGWQQIKSNLALRLPLLKQGQNVFGLSARRMTVVGGDLN